jgi:hypothetical protein
LNVRWNFDSSLTAHGTPSISSGSTTATDASGTASFTYQANEEHPDAHVNGYLTSTTSRIEASMPIADLLQQVFSLPANAALFFSSGQARYPATLVIEWHEPAALRLELLNPYDVMTRDLIVGGNAHQWGTDTIKGDLILDDDGVTYRGIMIGKANGRFTGKAYGKSCSTRWNTTQLLQVVATVNDTLKTIRFSFAPVDPASGRLSRGRCRPTMWQSDETGFYFAPYNDYAIIQPGGLSFVMFDKPGGDADYPVPPGPTNVTIRNTLWHVHMEYLEQP